jgi:hypothetical protein
MKRIAFLSSCILLLATFAVAQKDKSARPSPPAQAQCSFSDGKNITIDYSSPRAKGRKVFGDLVPYGEVWRTGANEATAFVTSTNLFVNGKAIPAGNYTIFTIPNKDKWTLIVNKKTGEWGIPYKYESDELLRTDMQVSQAGSSVENFNISLDQSGAGCTMNISWETTKASVDFKEGK